MVVKPEGRALLPIGAAPAAQFHMPQQAFRSIAAGPLHIAPTHRIYPASPLTGFVAMQISFAGKIALVTGSTSGIGLAVARGLAAAGAETIVNGRARDKVERVVADLTRALPEATLRGVAADV